MTSRRYARIWEAIKAAPVGTEIPVRVHNTAIKTVRQAVVKEKNRDAGIKRKLDMLRPGKLNIRIVTEGVTPKEYALLYFSLDFNGEKI